MTKDQIINDLNQTAESLSIAAAYLDPDGIANESADHHSDILAAWKIDQAHALVKEAWAILLNSKSPEK